MLLLFFEKFSEWVELVPLRTATADILKKAFRDRVMARFGTPKMLVTDNGVQFASRTFTKFLAELGVKPQFTARHQRVTSDLTIPIQDNTLPN